MKVHPMESARNAFFMDIDAGSVCWFGSSWPMKGEYISCLMRSGKTGLFKVTKVHRPSDPGDQIFLKVKFSGYQS